MNKTQVNKEEFKFDKTSNTFDKMLFNALNQMKS